MTPPRRRLRRHLRLPSQRLWVLAVRCRRPLPLQRLHPPPPHRRAHHPLRRPLHLRPCHLPLLRAAHLLPLRMPLCLAGFPLSALATSTLPAMQPLLLSIVCLASCALFKQRLHSCGRPRCNSAKCMKLMIVTPQSAAASCRAGMAMKVLVHAALQAEGRYPQRGKQVVKRHRLSQTRRVLLAKALRRLVLERQLLTRSTMAMPTLRMLALGLEPPPRVLPASHAPSRAAFVTSGSPLSQKRSTCVRRTAWARS